MNKTAHILVGLGFGDEGKGTMTDYLCQKNAPDLCIRFNGGSQAGHNVVLSDTRQHCFSQFGSGSFAGVKTLLSRYMMWNPFGLVHEDAALTYQLKGQQAKCLLSIDSRAPVITPYHVYANRIKEYCRGAGRHGSCGKGVGELAYDLVNHPNEVIKAADLGSKSTTVQLLQKIKDRKRNEIEVLLNHSGRDSKADPFLAEQTQSFYTTGHALECASVYHMIFGAYDILLPEDADKLIRESNIVMEGAQGVLLDEWKGFHPHTTWSTTTQYNALDLLIEAGFEGDIETTGIIRTYTTRHGNGPLPSEDSLMQSISPGEHNAKNEHQGSFRIGAFDAVLLDYAMKCVGKLDNIALTHVDCLARNGAGFPYLGSYELPGTGRIWQLPYLEDRDLDFQTKLTNTLNLVSDHHKEYVHRPEEFFRMVENVAQTRIKYLSHGPTADQKEVRSQPFRI